MEVLCPWSFLDTSLLPWLGATIILIGGLGAVGNLGLVTSLVFGELATCLPHVNLLLLVSCAVAGLGRALLAGFPFSAPGLLAGGWIFGPQCCQLFAAFGQFFFSAQMATLAALAYERSRESEASQARGRGLLVKRPSSKPHLITALCWGFAIFWSVPPLLNIGSYTCDVTHTSCDLDWRFTSPVNTTYNAAFAIFGVFVPIVLSVVWLSQAMVIGLQSRKDDPWDPDFVQAQQTKVILAITCLLFLTWIPKTAFALWTAFGFPQDLYIQIRLQPVLVASITVASEISTLIVPLILFIFDYYVRGSLIRIWRYHQQHNEY